MDVEPVLLRDLADALHELADKLEDFEQQDQVERLEGISAIALALKTIHCVVPSVVRATIKRFQGETGLDVTADPTRN